MTVDHGKLGARSQTETAVTDSLWQDECIEGSDRQGNRV